MIELIPESAHVASLLSEPVAEKPAIPLPKRMMLAYNTADFFETLVIFNFNNISYAIDLNYYLFSMLVMFTLAKQNQAAYFRNSDTNGWKITGPHCTEFFKNTVITL